MKRYLIKLLYILLIMTTSSNLMCADEKMKSINYLKSKGAEFNIDNTILSSDKLNDSDLSYLVNLEQLSTLCLLSGITDDGIKYVKYLSNLKNLHIQNTKITDKGLEYIKDLKKLELLNLSDTKITDRGLARLEKLTNLLDLHLTNTNITDEGLKTIQKFKKLSELNLNGTRISDKGLKYLEGLSNLQILTIASDNVTQDGIQKLKNKLRDCRVYWEGILIYPDQ